MICLCPCRYHTFDQQHTDKFACSLQSAGFSRHLPIFMPFMGLQFCPQPGTKTVQQVGKRGEALAALQPVIFYSDSEREIFCLRNLARCYKPWKGTCHCGGEEEGEKEIDAGAEIFFWHEKAWDIWNLWISDCSLSGSLQLMIWPEAHFDGINACN